jgi:transcriptional regulator
MAIYTPEQFAARDEALAHRLIHDHPFATVITTVHGAEPHVTYIPMQLEDGVLLGHVARANPHWRQFADGHTVALFHGPHAFISPYWYERPADNVPTWNYAVVHVHGRARIDDDGQTRAHLERLFARFDGRPLPTDPAKIERLLGGIVPFRLPIERIDVKLKMNQNKSAADRAGVIAGLRATGRAEDRATADWMETHES